MVLKKMKMNNKYRAQGKVKFIFWAPLKYKDYERKNITHRW